MTQARYDAIAEFYIEGFDSIDDPASRALLDLLGPVAGLRSSTWHAATDA